MEFIVVGAGLGAGLCMLWDWLTNDLPYDDVLPSYFCRDGEHHHCTGGGWNRDGSAYPILPCPCPCHKKAAAV